MFEYMGDRISNALKNIRGMGKITEDNIGDATREIRIALLEADVNYQVVKEFLQQLILMDSYTDVVNKKLEFVADVKAKALDAEVGKSLKPDEVFLKIVKDELVSLLGGDYVPLEVNKKPTILMLVGLQGSGKTTTAGKLANYLRKKHSKKPLLVAADIYRPAAIDQLKTLGKELNIDVFSKDGNVTKIVSDAIEFAKENNNDYIIIDTAGRLQIDEVLMQELKDVDEAVHPHEKILVIDGSMGQDAINVITGFNSALDLTGCILTKLDGNTKGGVALSVRHLTHIPIKFVGTSEKMDGLSEFYPDRMAERILDMGDILEIVSKVEDVIDEDVAKEQAKKMKKGTYDLNDFLSNLKQIKKLGPLENILKMLPQARKMGLNNISIDPKDLAHVEAILQSMTPEERRKPEILKASRKQRIAKGSGRSVEEVNRLLKQFEMMKDMMKKMSSGNMPF